MLLGMLNLNLLLSTLIYLGFFTLKSPLPNQYNTRVSHIIGSLVYFSQIVLFSFLLFNTTIVAEKRNR